MIIKTFQQFENKNTNIIGPVKLINILLDKETYYLETSEGTFQFNESEKDNLGIANLPKKGYNYVFEVDDDTIKRVIFYVVDLIIIAKNKILLIKRKNEPFSNHWALPGGFVDDGEIPLQSAVRELEEETSLILDKSSLQYIGEYNNAWRDPRNKWVTSYAFCAKLDNIENVKAMDDATEAEWIDITKIQNLKLAFDHEKIIEDALR